MSSGLSERKTALNFIGAVILIVGLGSALWIYRAADRVSGDILGYEQGYGSPYPVAPEDSKKYLRDLELYGGKANVLADEFRRWFEGLWQGRSLAFTVGAITIFAGVCFFYAASRSPTDLGSDPCSPKSRDRTG